jgi:hypothetical protein
LYQGGRHVACKYSMRLAASRIKFVPEWPPVAHKLYPRVAASRRQIGGHAGTICIQLAATQVQFVCDWPPVTSEFRRG